MTTARRLASLLLILAAPMSALAATPPPAATAPAATPAAATTPPGPPAPDPDVVYYPAAARAVGIEGKAVIHCGRTSHLKLTGCTLVSETPAGQGFGAAALAMAADSHENPKIDTADAQLTAPADIAVTFALHPVAGVDPDLTSPAHVFSGPAIVAAPTPEQIKNAWPVRALDDSVEGVAALDCLVTAAGVLQNCRVAAERPDGYGFGRAALDLAGDFKLTPRLVDGTPTAVRVPLTVPFRLADPTAPLQLQTIP